MKSEWELKIHVADAKLVITAIEMLSDLLGTSITVRRIETKHEQDEKWEPML